MTLRDFVARHSALAASLGAALIVVSLSLSAIHPLLFGSLTRSDDSLQHLYRLIALDQAIQHGNLWPRYVPTLVYGYGEPIFNFYSPLSLYPFALLHGLGLRFQDAMLVGLILYALVGAGGAFKLGERWGGPLAGIGAAAGYAYAPYGLHTFLARGAVGEVAALALLPWLLWAFHRLSETRRRRHFVTAVVLLALVVLAHNIIALMALALLIAFCLLWWWLGDNPPRVFVQLGLAGLLALGLTAFFWLPALAESSYVQLERTQIGVNAPPGAPDFMAQFQTLDQTFAAPSPADLTQFNPPPRRTLSWPQILLALLGIGLALSAPSESGWDARRRRWLIMALAMTLVCVFMTTPLSAAVWATVPLLNYFQFPWRALGPASLMLALLAGQGIAEGAKLLARRATQGLWIGVSVAAILLGGMPALYHLYVPDPPALSIIDAHNHERATGQIGGTARGEYLPRWVKELPDPNRLAGLFAAGDIIPRLQPLSSITVIEQTWEPTRARLKFAATEDTVLTFDWLYFPGWQAWLDGKESEALPSEPNGFVTVAVPQGEHRLDLSFGPTPLRFAATAASAVFCVLAGVSLAIPRLWDSAPPLPDRPSLAAAPRLAVVAAATGLGLFALKAALFDNANTPIKQERFAAGVEQGLQHPVWGVFNGEVTLLGYDLATPKIASGQSGRMTAYWQPTDAMIPNDYASMFTLRDEAGSIAFEGGSIFPGGWATSVWVPGFWVEEPVTLNIPPATPPGVYRLDASLYWPQGGRSLDALDGNGQPVGARLQIGSIEVLRPGRPARIDDLPPADWQALIQLDAKLTDSIALAAASPLPPSAEVGQPLPLVVYWRAEQAPRVPLSFRLAWEDSKGALAAVSPSYPLAGGYSSEQWQPGDLWRGSAQSHVPGRLATGIYAVSVQLVDAQGQPVGDPAALGQAVANAPPRSFSPPRPAVPTTVTWANGIRLIGYDLASGVVRRGDPVRLTLHWQPTSELDTSLTLFVHVIDAEGNIVGQVDTLPGGGKRPTTGWAPGEYLSETYQVVIKPGAPRGEYYIRLGWYNAATGERMTVINAAPPDSWLLPQTIRVP